MVRSVRVVLHAAAWVMAVPWLAFAAPPTKADTPAPAASADAPPQDPLERLGERLAERLGAQRTPEGDGSLLMRVPAKTPAAATKAAAPKPATTLCSHGKRQSPIDIRDAIRVDLDPIDFAYGAGGFRVHDTGRTVRVLPAPGNTIEVLGQRYALQHVEFHRPAPERIDGRSFEMGAHLVHRADDGRLAVVAVLLQPGAAHPVVQAAWNNLPLERGGEVAARAQLDPGELLPGDRRYATFMGSLMTPPCTEGVLWMVMQQPVTVSAAQLEIFARLYPQPTARPVQPLAGRLIKQSN